MPLVATKANASAFGFGWSSAQPDEVLGGMVLITPTSITSTGAGNSSSIGTNGSVTFTACTTLSLNGVFTSSFDNYVIVMQTSSSGGGDLSYRLRASGTDASGANYHWQYVRANNTTLSAARGSALTTGAIGSVDITGTARDGHLLYLYFPFTASATSTRSVEAYSGFNNPGAEIYDYAGYHSLAASYDGITIYPGSGSISGLISIYGMRG